ncbi:MAG: hypothetical protein K9I94_08800 [Bacteroidales bacterium]|nr:hypothetical protein [Bacteroidales bacterium]
MLFAFSGCRENINGELVTINANPEKGFHYPYFLFLPDNMSGAVEVHLIVEPNNSGFVDDDLQKHLEKARRTATKDYYIGNYVARELKYPLLVPVFPRSRTNWKTYTHSLDRDVMLEKGTNLERIDLQLLAMVKDASQILKDKGFTVNDKLLMTGFSASGTFANRFSLIHPEHLQAVAAGGLNGLLMLPADELNGVALNYPVGIMDFDSLCGKKFNIDAFKKLPQFLFAGELDDNDAIPYDDAFDESERKVIFEVLGKEMFPKRWNKCRELYHKFQINAEIKSYPGVGHEHPEAVKKEVVDFFTSHLKK